MADYLLSEPVVKGRQDNIDLDFIIAQLALLQKFLAAKKLKTGDAESLNPFHDSQIWDSMMKPRDAADPMQSFIARMGKA